MRYELIGLTVEKSWWNERKFNETIFFLVAFCRKILFAGIMKMRWTSTLSLELK